MAEEDRRALIAEANRMGYGSLGGAGVDHHESVHAALDKDGHGIAFTLNCDGCGKPMSIVAPWDELIYLSQGFPPPNQSWYHDPSVGCFMPNLVCSCRNPIRLGVTPDECTKHLRSGVSGGKVSEAYVRGAIQ